MKEKDFEIMAPVGSYESLMAAIQGGADSIYFGIEGLNMRSRSSNNFTTEDLRKIVAICGEHGIKSYLTVNTVIYGEDLPLMREIIDAAKDAGVSAIIAADVAAMSYANSIGQEVHLSTQLNISNVEALKFYARFADVVVLARELNLKHVKGLLNGTAADIPLQKNDILYIPSIHDLKEEATLTIHGEVANPGTYLYSDKMTVEDLVLQAGGLLEAAATTKVEVARRMKDPKSTSFSTTVGQNFSFDLKDGLLVGEGSQDFHLEPFDEIYVRKSPSYFKQQNVMVGGEVLFSGNYALSKKNERLSDLIAKAGGVTPDAYIKGARLIRRMTEEEFRRKEDALRMAQAGGGDSISVKRLDLSDTYSVGINLGEALKNPGSDADMVLREGDVLFVPEYVSTVKINGAVMYPNTVLYKKGESLKYYINQAGGFGNDAKKRKVYVIYMNGTVSRLKAGNKKAIEPGCEIIVPSKEQKKKMTTAEILGMGSTTASIAAMIATMVNLFK